MHPEKGVVHDTESYLYRQARPRHARIVHLYDTITHDLVKKRLAQANVNPTTPTKIK